MSSLMSIFKSNDLRVCHYCIKYMKESGMELSVSGYFDPKSCCRNINDALDKHFKGDEDGAKKRVVFVEGMNNDWRNNVIEMDMFSWVKNDEMACYWLWGFLYKSKSSDLGVSPMANIFKSSYQGMKLDASPQSNEKRIQVIVSFFDQLALSKELKLSLIKKRQSEWQEIYEKRGGLFKWLDKENETQCRWAWDYTKKAHQQTEIESHMDESDIPSSYLKPLTIKEIYMAIHVSVYLWGANKYEIKNYISSISKAWSQKKLRATREGTKQLNTNLRSSVKDKLDALSRHHDKRISEMLEVIILAEYKRMKGEVE